MNEIITGSAQQAGNMTCLQAVKGTGGGGGGGASLGNRDLLFQSARNGVIL
jgi:hypothetical protein